MNGRQFFLALCVCVSFGSSQGMWRAGTRGIAGVIAAKALHHATAGQRSYALPASESKPVTCEVMKRLLEVEQKAREERKYRDASIPDICELIVAAPLYSDDPEILTRHKGTALLQSALAQGKKVNERGRCGRNGLTILAQDLNEFQQEVRILLEAGVDANDIGFGYSGTLLHYAPDSLLPDLVKAGVDINKKNQWGQTPLFEAAARHSISEYRSWGMCERVKLLLELGAKLDATVLNATQDPDIASLLLSHGADIEAQIDRGRTPLFYAVDEYRNIAVLEVLLMHNPNIYARDDSGDTVWTTIDRRMALYNRLLDPQAACLREKKRMLRGYYWKVKCKEIMVALSNGLEGEMPLGV